MVAQESGVVTVQVFYSHHNGSCGKTFLSEASIARLTEAIKSEVTMARNQSEDQTVLPRTAIVDPDALAQTVASMLDGYYRPETMRVGHAEYVSLHLDALDIEFAKSQLPTGSGPIYISAAIEGADNFKIDTLDEPEKQITAKKQMDWDWIVEPVVQGEGLPLIVRVVAFTGKPERRVSQVSMLKHLDKVPSTKTLGARVLDWLTSLAGAVTSLMVVLGGVWAAFGFFRSKGRGGKEAAIPKPS